ncbi:MAG: class II aldolase/adducin family protein [Campylobacterales bacterium]|nr:class II aldolase/adducin family protein [Campylobacterales bacterium]
MKNLWNDEVQLRHSHESGNLIGDDLKLRVYTSNLFGRSDELVLHGGGNTSVKTVINGEEILLVKGSGWDLVSIKAEGFAPVKMKTLLEMAELKSLRDSDMVAGQKAAMIDKTAPNPSVEAILHALIPYKFVDHTHADAVVTISNSACGIENIKEVFPNFLIVPYVMPGFILARTIYEMTQGLDWNRIDGIILHNHGIFTFDNDAKKSYEKMIKAVTHAEEFLEKNAKVEFSFAHAKTKEFDVKKLQQLLSKEKGYEVFIKENRSDLAKIYASKDENIEEAIENYKNEYENYFKKFAKNEICLNSAPNFIVVKNYGILACGKSEQEANIINDIVEHTMMAVLRADKLGGYKSISLKDSFEMEYWELEQAKLKK